MLRAALTLPHGLSFALRQKAEQRPGDGEPQRPRLAGSATAAHGAVQVETAQQATELQREHQLLPEPGQIGETGVGVTGGTVS